MRSISGGLQGGHGKAAGNGWGPCAEVCKLRLKKQEHNSRTPADVDGEVRLGGKCLHAGLSSLQPPFPIKSHAHLSPSGRLELPTEDVQANVRLMGVRQGRGAAIVIAAVEPGSAAAAAGVRPGQQLLAVSDPIRRGEFWQINGQSSLRYVCQAISMRVAETITLQLTAQPIREWRRAVEASRAAQRAAAAALTPQPQAPAGQPQDDDLLSNIVRASIDSSMGSLDSFDSGDASSSSAAASGDSSEAGPGLTAAGRAAAAKLTVAEKLEQRYIEGQAAADALAAQESDLERRKRRRKEYFEQVRGAASPGLGWLSPVQAFYIVGVCVQPQ